MDRTKCRHHPQKDLTFFCCNALICDECRAEHSDHNIQEASEIAEHRRRDLLAVKREVEKALIDVKYKLQQAESEHTDFQKSVERTRRTLQKHLEAIIQLAKQCHNSAVSKLESLRQEGEKELKQPILRLRSEVDRLHDQKDEIEKLLNPSAPDQHVIKHSPNIDITKARASPPLSDVKLHWDKCKVRVAWKGEGQQDVQAAIQDYMGMPSKIEMSLAMADVPSVCLVPQFQMLEEPTCTITAILPLRDSVCVTCKVESDAQTFSRVLVVTKCGEKLKEEQMFETSQLAMVHQPLPDSVLVFSPIKHSSKLVNLGKNTIESTKDYYCLQEGGSSYVILQGNPLAKTAGRSSRKVSAKLISRPQMLGVSADGQYFAVVTEYDEILVYQDSVSDFIMALRPTSKSNGPTSVCFHPMGERLMLLVADASKDAICLVDCGERRVLGPLVLGSRRLQSPCALASDGKDTVWIACKNGDVLTCLLTTTLLQENPTYRPNEDRYGYLHPVEADPLLVKMKPDEVHSLCWSVGELVGDKPRLPQRTPSNPSLASRSSRRSWRFLSGSFKLSSRK